ncbi:MAG: cytochrome C [Acidimicrobiia bacterium]
MSVLDRILGPRIPKDELGEQAARYRLPKWMFTAAALLLMVSLLLPYWVLNLKAPQFPDGLQVRAYVNRLEGDVVELEGLNHYVGLKSFEDAAVFERSVAIMAVIVFAGLLVAALLIHSRWVLLLVLPGLLFPIVFLADLQFWLWNFGNNLDPRAPLAAAVGEFTPPVFGSAEIAQFDTLALPGLGLILAMIASVLIGVGLWFHRKAFKPLIDSAGAV